MNTEKQIPFKFPLETRWIAGAGNVLSRIEFTLDTAPVSAKIWIVADPHSYAKEYWQRFRNDGHDGNWLLGGSFLKYRIFINGRLIGAGPARPLNDGVPAIHCFESDLRKGRNALGIFSRGEKKGIAVFLEVILKDNRRFQLVSNSEWKELNINNCYSPICWERQNIDQFFKGCAGPGEWAEHIDGTQYPFGWNDIHYDDHNWLNSITLGPVNETIESCYADNLCITEIKPSSISRTDQDRWLVDFGNEYIGGLELTGPPNAEKVELRMGEEMFSENEVRYQMRTGNCYHESWTFPAGKRTLNHFGLRSFRYLEITNYPAELTEDMVSIISVSAPFDRSKTSFSCEDAELKQVWDLCKNSIALTVMDTYNDCFTRERLVYEADVYISMLSHFALDNNYAPAKRSIEYLIKHPTWPCEWRQFMIPLFYEYVMHTGDVEFAGQYYHVLREQYSFIDLMERDGLIARFPQQIIVDWPVSCQDNYDFGDYCAVPNAFLYWDLLLLSKLAGIIGKDMEQVELSVLAGQVKAAFNDKLFDAETGLYVDSENSNHSSFHANMFALRFGLVTQEYVDKCLEFIIGKGMVCSVYGAQFYLDVLFMYNRPEAAVSLMTADNDTSWLGMIRNGATITTESWNPGQKTNMSWAHPWGTAPANIVARHLFGLRPTAPGWSSYQFEPQPGGIKQAELTIQTPQGIIQASFKTEPSGEITKSLFSFRKETQAEVSRS